MAAAAAAPMAAPVAAGSRAEQGPGLEDALARPAGRRVTEAGLGDAVQLLGVAPRFLRATSLALRSLYAAPPRWCEALAALQDRLLNEAVVVKKFLLPLTVCLFMQLQKVFDHYLLNGFDVWQTKTADVAESAQEFAGLFGALVAFYSHLGADLAVLPALAEEVHKSCVQETIKFQRESGILQIKSFVYDDLFVPLLYNPGVDFYATPLAQGGASGDFRKPVVAKTDFEKAVAAALAATHSLVPAVAKLGALAAGVEDFLRVLHEELQDLSDAAEEEKRRHYELVRPKAYHVERAGSDLNSIVGNFFTDLQCIPEANPVDFYQQWLEEREFSSGGCIVDHARKSTANVEILGALDP